MNKKDRRYYKKIKGEWEINHSITLSNNSFNDSLEILKIDSSLVDSFLKSKVSFSFDNNGNYTFTEIYRDTLKWKISNNFILSRGHTWYGNLPEEQKELELEPPNQVSLDSFKGYETWYAIVSWISENEIELYDPMWRASLRLKRKND